MNRTGVFLQARLNSSRLPRKALLDLGGRTALERVMESLSPIEADYHVLLTDEGSAETFAPYAAGCGFEVFVGDPEDLLSRYASAVRHYGVERYIRATGDNPLVSAVLSERLLGAHVSAEADFSGYLGPPLGTGVEIVEAKAILEADVEATDPFEREHASPFIYRRPDRYVVRRPWAPENVNLPGAHVTLDTEEDYTLLRLIYDSLFTGEPIETEPLVEWLLEHREAWREHGSAFETETTACTVGGTG